MAYTTIDDPSAYFQTALYTGASGDGAITNDGNSDLQPDWIWFKRRDDTGHNRIFDSTRGVTKRMQANETNGDATTSDALTAFNSDGFSLGADSTDIDVNQSSSTMVAWQWKANGGTRTTFTESGNNPGGGYQANTTAGFSILDYTGTGAAGTVAHGLGVVPELMIVKDRSGDGDDWFVYHVSTGNDGGMRFNTTAADGDDSNRWNDTTPTSSVCTFGASGGTNDDGKTTIAYVFAPIQGYSKFGKYTGNGNTNGAFVYLGFKPAFLIIKRSDNTSSWHIWDNKREDYDGNPNNTAQRSDSSGAESDSTDYSIDFLSNGIKVRNASDLAGASGGTYIYIAFAEHPFVSSEGVPVTAR